MRETIKGKVFSFEGIDGCGKSTIVNMLNDYLKDKGYNVEKYRQPGGTKGGEVIREALFSKNRVEDFLAKRLLFVSDYREFVYQALGDKEKVVLTDRCVIASNPVYGAAEASFNIKEMEDRELYNVLYYTVPLYEDLKDYAPNIIFILDVDLKVSYDRTNNRSGGNYYDSEGCRFRERCKHAYKLLPAIEEASPGLLGLDTGSDIFVTIDANGTIEDTFSKVLEVLNERYEI